MGALTEAGVQEEAHLLTLCLAVLARHVDRLQFIDIMLGDQPALTPQQAPTNACLPVIPSRRSNRPGPF